MAFRLAYLLHHLLSHPAESMRPRWQDLYLNEKYAKLQGEFSKGLLLLMQAAFTVATFFAVGLKSLVLLWVGARMYNGSLFTAALAGYILVHLFCGILYMPFYWAKSFAGYCAVTFAEIVVAAVACTLAVRYFNVGTMMMVSVALTGLFTMSYGWRKGALLLKVSSYAAKWSQKDIAQLIGQAALLGVGLAMVWLLDRMGASFVVTLSAGLLMSLVVAVYFLFWSRTHLQNLYRLRHTATEAPVIEES